MQNYRSTDRRPLAVRSNKIVQKIARWLSKRSFPTPNQISLFSILFAVLGAIALSLIITGEDVEWKLIICAICIQLRLLCNLFDGMVAVEGNKLSPLGALYNEVPDRIADSVLFVALGFALSELSWGLFLALVAMMTAYIRNLGGALGLPQSFRGPMAKQHRMAMMTAVCIIGAIEWYVFKTNYSLYLALILLVIGSLITCVVRLIDIAKLLNQSGK